MRFIRPFFRMINKRGSQKDYTYENYKLLSYSDLSPEYLGPWYVSNFTLHKDLAMAKVNDHIRTLEKKKKPIANCLNLIDVSEEVEFKKIIVKCCILTDTD